MQNKPVHAYHIMKTDIMFRRVLTALAFAAVLALPPAPARAQTNDLNPNPPPRGRRGLPPAPARSQTNSSVQYDLEIENGGVRISQEPGFAQADLNTIVKLLRDKHPEANIAMSPELVVVQVSDLKLRAASLEEELEALKVASGDKFTWFANHYSSNASPPLFSLEPSELFSREKFLKENAPSPKSQVQVEVFNFSSYFDYHRESGTDDAKLQAFKQQTIEKTKDIIRETLADFGAVTMKFQFHPGANLLVVTGSQDEINIARKIINAMIEKTPGDLPSSFKKTLEDALKKMSSNLESTQ